MADSPVSSNGAKVVLDGYDVVSYFCGTGPEKGRSRWVTWYQGVAWRFASAENKAKFDADPEKYLPKFGGYCAFAVAAGKVIKGAGKYGAVIDGKLYFSVNRRIKQRYLDDPASYNSQAEENWQAVQEKIRQSQKS
ncbi:YHS domain-containing (seleno)protein [Candidatus Haliotispira prima]|uniref:YHS domain-containing (Seleno)protein n=1 Tax=Candidatus Haliotispira prima TaxID=3034016 RepID=A0ABY8MGF1_9SPIO|nr:YHS domain-containing (seleno)protein [Candidatus Haliotispira prima]